MGSKHVGVRKSEFVAKTQFLSLYAPPPSPFLKFLEYGWYVPDD